MSMSQPISVLFVCMGNHCRSPVALAVARKVAAERGLDRVVFDAAGVTTHHRGELPHPLSSAEGARRGYNINHLGRPIHPDDFERFDLIVAMDMMNIDDLRRLGGSIDHRYAMPGDENIADPWGKPAAAHREMLDVIERSVPPLVEHLAWLMSETV
jgi:protein-tyrosine phosphatase